MGIFEAIKRQRYDDVKLCLEKENQLVSLQDHAGLTPLHYAAITGNPYIIQLLSEYGADLNQKAGSLGLTPLHYAAMFNQAEAIEKLNTLGADVNLPNAKGDTPLDLVVQLSVSVDSLKSYNVIYRNFTDFLEKKDYFFDAVLALLKVGANPGEWLTNSRFIQLIIADDRADILRALVERGFDCRSQNDEESTQIGFDFVFLFAAANCAVDCLAYLIELYPEGLMPREGSDCHNIDRNLIACACQQLPEETIFKETVQFLEMQTSDLGIVKKEVLDALLPKTLKSCEHEYGFDSEKQRYYVSKVEYGLCFLDFNPDGTCKNIESLLTRLSRLLDWYKAQGLPLNHSDKSGMRNAQFTLQCPRPVIDIFIAHGMKYHGWDLHWAIHEYSPEVIDRLIEVCDLSYETQAGNTALSLLEKSQRDELLNARPALMKKIQTTHEKQLEGQLNELSLDGTSSSDTFDPSETRPSLLMQFTNALSDANGRTIPDLTGFLNYVEEQKNKTKESNNVNKM